MDKKVKSFLDNIDKKFGKETICRDNVEIERVSSGSISLDLALGGGYPVGRIIEGVGWESSSKTSCALHLAAEVQKNGGRVGYIDSENALDLFYAKKIGVDVDIEGDDPKFFLAQPSTGEESLELVREFADSGLFKLIVIDSVASLVPKALLLGDVGDQKMAVIARLMSQWVPALTSVANKSGCIIYFINQYREKLGAMFGSNLTAPGGNALKFYASQKLEFARIGQLKDSNDEVIGIKVRVKVLKNKVSPPFKKAEFDVIFGEGISREGEILDYAVVLELVKKSGSWYSYEDVKLGQGRNTVIELLKDTPELTEELETKIRKELGI